MIDTSLVNTTEAPVGIIHRLKENAIKSVFIQPVTSHASLRERPTNYMVRLQGETRKRRVYIAAIGNTGVQFIKSNNQYYYCELALDAALVRAGDVDDEDVLDPPFPPQSALDLGEF